MLKNYLASIPEQKRGLWLIRAHNGLRPSEARELNVQDYDFQRDTVTLRHSKKSGPRNEVELVTFSVDWEVAEWIHRWVDPRDAVRGYAPLFQNPDSYNDHHRWTPASERRVHVAACAEIGAYFKPNHCGRHAFGTHAMRRLKERTGAYDIAAVQKAMRHADPRTTQGYIDRDVIDIVHVLRPKGA